MSAVIQNEYTGNNSTTTYSFTFPYLKTSDIKASLDGVDTTAFTLPNATTLQFNTAPGSGVKIKIFRETSVDDLTATFYAGSAIKSEDLNDNFTQNLYKTQEVSQRDISSLGGTMTGDLNFGTQAQIVFEGATDDAHETTLTITDPTADRTITLPNVTGTIVTTGDTATVSHGMIAGDAIDGDNIADNSINSEHYVDGSIDTAHIADGQVTHVKLGSDAVDGDNIADDSINSEHYVDGSIDTAHLAALQVTTPKIANENITTAKLENNAVTSVKILDANVTTAKIADANVTTAKIADDAVTSAKLATGAIDTNALGSDSVNTGNIVNSAISTAKIANDAVTYDKIANGQVTNIKLANHSVSTSKIDNNAITSVQIADSAVTTAKIATNAVTDAEIATGTLDNRYFTETELTGGALDGRYFTETESDARYFNISSGETIKDGDTFPDNDTTIATTAAINDRIIDLVDEVGGFDIIASEQHFPNTNPGGTTGQSAVLSVKEASTNLVPSGTTVTINNGNLANNANITITGVSSTIPTGFGFLVESTSTTHTYTFHRLVPKATEVTTVAGNITNINAVANNATNINAVQSNATNINAVASNATNINTVAGSNSDINTVAGNNSNINAVAGNATNINAVQSNATNITTVAGNNANVTTVAGNNANVTTVASNIANVNTVGGAISNVNSVAGSISNVNTVATNLTEVNNFGDTYQIASSDPSTRADGSSLQEGDLVFNTTADQIKVYNGSAWQGGVTATGNFAVKAGNTFTGDNVYNDNVKAKFGTGNDLEIFHNASDSVINDAGTGNLKLQTGGSTKLEITSTGATITGNVAITGNVDGRDLAADGTKLDGIAANANVGLTDIVGDTTPQLGGNLDVQSSEITTSTSNGNIKVTPNGTGVVEVKGAGGYDGTLQLNCSVNSHGIKLKSPAHSAAANYTLTFPTTDGNNHELLKSDGNGNLSWTTVGADNLATNAVITASITDASVTTPKIADDAVTAAKILDGGVGTSALANNAVTLAKLEQGTSSNDGKFLRANNGADPTFETISSTPADGSITTDKLASNAVTNSKIANGHITSAKLDTYAVTNVKIANDAVSTAKIADDAITTAKLAADAVTASELANGIVDQHKLASNAVTNVKIADDAVDEANLKVSNSPTNGYVLTAQSGNTGGLTWAAQTDTNTTYSAGSGLTLSGTTFSANVSKSDVGLGNVENTALSTWSGSTNITTLGTVSTVTSTAPGTAGVRKIYTSTSSPSGGANGDIWIKYT